MKTIGIATKLTLGPARHVTCRNCKARISVPWSWLKFSLICVIFGVGGAVLLNGFAFIMYLLFFGAVTGWITYKYVPLIVKEDVAKRN